MDMQDLIHAFKNHWKLIATIILTSTIMGGAISYSIAPSYEAKTDLLINSTTENTENPAAIMSEIDTNLRLIETYKQILKSDRMVSRVNKELGELYSRTILANKIKIEAGNGSQIITIIATENTEEKAANLANTYALAFQEEIRTLMNISNITILKEVLPGVDTKKNEPTMLIYMILSFFIGVIVSLMLVIVKEVYFPYLNSKQKVEMTLKVPLLGSIISTGNKKFGRVKRDITSEIKFPRAASEDFSKLAANIHYLTKENKLRTMMLTSLNRGDGKTFVGCHLAVKLAMNGQKVLFIDADFRKPDGRFLFDLPERKGLTSSIAGYYDVKDIIQQTTTENLSFISTGPLPSNPVQFLQSQNMNNVLGELKQMFDVIIIDTSALTVADAVTLLPMMDGCIYIADVQKTKAEKAIQGLESLKKVGGEIVGVVLNSKKNHKVKTA